MDRNTLESHIHTLGIHLKRYSDHTQWNKEAVDKVNLFEDNCNSALPPETRKLSMAAHAQRFANYLRMLEETSVQAGLRPDSIYMTDIFRQSEGYYLIGLLYPKDKMISTEKGFKHMLSPEFTEYYFADDLHSTVQSLVSAFSAVIAYHKEIYNIANSLTYVMNTFVIAPRPQVDVDVESPQKLLLDLAMQGKIVGDLHRAYNKIKYPGIFTDDADAQEA